MAMLSASYSYSDLIWRQTDRRAQKRATSSLLKGPGIRCEYICMRISLGRVRRLAVVILDFNVGCSGVQDSDGRGCGCVFDGGRIIELQLEERGGRSLK